MPTPDACTPRPPGGAIEPPFGPRFCSSIRSSSCLGTPSGPRRGSAAGAPPRPLRGAGAAGAAVLATAVGDVSLALDEGRAGLIAPPANVRALAAALRRLVDDPEERDRLAAAARIRVEERFSRDRLVRSIHELYVRASLRRRRP